MSAPLKKEPLTLDEVEAILKQREQEKQFWQKFNETHIDR